MPAPKQGINWKKVEEEYRVGASVSEMARELGVQPSAISNRARRYGWARDLVAPIRSAAKEKVARELARRQAAQTRAANSPSDTPSNNSVNHVQPDSTLVDLNATVLAALDLAHRGDAKAARELCKAMLDELSATQDGAALIRNLMEIQADAFHQAALDHANSVRGVQAADKAHQARLDAIERVMSLSGRSGTLKQLVDSLEKLVKLERAISGLEERRGETDGYEAVLKGLRDLAASRPEAFEGDVPGFLQPGGSTEVH